MASSALPRQGESPRSTSLVRSERILSSVDADGPRSIKYHDEDDSSIATTLERDEEAYSHKPRPQRRFWLLGCGICAVLLAVVAVLNGLLFAATSMYTSADLTAELVRSTIPIPCHSHNDYWRKVPVFSALHVGCIGIEADVWLADDDLYVGHIQSSLRPNRTFSKLYIEPLTRIIEAQNGPNDPLSSSSRGVYDMDSSQTLVLLIDLKTGAKETWPYVMKQLEPLRKKGWLSFVEDGTVTHRAVTVVATGNSEFGMVSQNATYRDVFFDAPLEALEASPYDSTNSYYTSVSFKQTVGLVRFGRLSDGQVGTIRKQVAQAHSLGLKARYWGLPAWPISVRNHVWEVLQREGVDILNVDDLKGAREFLGHSSTTQ